MNIVLPIVLMAIVLGLFMPLRQRRTAYGIMGVWIALVIAWYYVKH